MGTTGKRDSRLFEWYRTYIGEPDRDMDVYLGFALFFGAVGLGVLALAAGLASGGGGPAFGWRTVAFGLGMVSVPTGLASVVVLLPVDRRALVGTVAGGGLCLAAVAWFSQVYPMQWASGPGPHYSTHVTLLYGLGVALSLGATGAALVGYHIDRVRRPHPSDIDAPVAEATEESETETVTDEQVRRDIDQMLDQADLNWGGVERTETTRLEFVDDDSFDASGMQVTAEEVRSETGVDKQVQDLQSLKAGERETHRSTSTVDEQTEQLQNLKQRREDDDDTDEAFLAELLTDISTRFGR